jgi:hypothetical protein
MKVDGMSLKTHMKKYLTQMDEINSQNSTYELQGKICGG